MMEKQKSILILFIITIGLLIVSFSFDYRKTLKGIKSGLGIFLNLLPTLLIMLAALSIVLYLLPPETLEKYMGEGSGILGWITAALMGSVALIPGFISFPLCSILVKNGVSYSVISVFLTTLMMVGIITMPVEAKFFGWRSSILRNVLSFLAALIIGFLMSLFL